MSELSKDELEVVKRIDNENQRLKASMDAEAFKEFEKQEEAKDIDLIKKRNRLRAMALGTDPEFLKLSEEELNLLKRYYPEDAKKIMEKIKKAKEQEAKTKKPNVEMRTELLTEIMGLAEKTLKVMIENLKIKNNRLKAEHPEIHFKENTPKSASERQNEVENVPEKHQQKIEEPETQYVLKEKKEGIISGSVKNIERDLKDGYTEGYTGVKPERVEENEYEVVAVRDKKQEKAWEKQQKQERKESKKRKEDKVSAVSLDEINREKENMYADLNKISKNELNAEEVQRRLDAYNKKTQMKAEQNQMGRQNEQPSSGMQMMPRSYKKN